MPTEHASVRAVHKPWRVGHLQPVSSLIADPVRRPADSLLQRLGELSTANAPAVAQFAGLARART